MAKINGPIQHLGGPDGKKTKITEAVVKSICSQADYDTWVSACIVSAPGEEPDTFDGFGVPFESAGILPYGCRVNPYDNEKYPLNQVGFSKLLADQYRDEIRYCHTDKTWYVFDHDKGWIANDSKNLLFDKIREFERRIQYACSLIDGETYQQSFAKAFLDQLSNNTRIKNVLELVSHEYAFSASEMDTRIDIIATQNGVIQLKTDGSFDFHAFRPEDMTTRHAGTYYDPDAKCPRWDQFILEIMDGDREKADFLQIFLGQSLYSENEQKAFAIFFGKNTNNGKSTLVATLKSLLGDYAVAVNEGLIQKHSNAGVHESSELAKTKGAKIVSLQEPSKDLQVNVATIKNITGRDSVSARFLNQNGFDFIPGYSLIISTNHELSLRDLSVFQRGSVVLFTFKRSFTGSEVDTQLEEKLKAELPGILNWLLEGWAKYCAACPDGRRWILPQSMQDDIADYWHRSDLVRIFLEENYVITNNPNDTVPKAEVYQQYRRWSLTNGDQPRSSKAVQPEIKARLAEMLGQRNIDPERKIGKGIRCYYGLRPINSDTEDTVESIEDKRRAFRHFFFANYEPSPHQHTPLEDIYSDYTNSTLSTKPLNMQECRWEIEDLLGNKVIDNAVSVAKRGTHQMQLLVTADSIA